MNNKIVDWMKKITSSDATLKRIAFYFFLLCLLLVIVIFKLSNINDNLKLIAENGNNIIEVNTKEDSFNNTLDVFIEEPGEIGDVLPQYNELTENNTSITKEEITSNKIVKPTINSNEDATTNSTTKTTFVININSKKIHYYDCSFVDRMKEENKKIVQLDTNELNEYFNNGYSACSTCGG